MSCSCAGFSGARSGPSFRLHGYRLPIEKANPEWRDGVKQLGTGAANEVWSFGPEVYAILVSYLKLRERLRPYVRETMRAAHERGTPVMRPLWYDFAADAHAWDVEDQYMFGDDILVAPVLEAGARERRVYLPRGARWADPYGGTTHEGGQTLVLTAPLARMPLMLRDGRALPITGGEP